MSTRTRGTAALAIAACLALLLLAAPVLAETRSWLDRSQIEQGETVTLNIETDQAGVAPDFGPLQADFDMGTPYRSERAGGGVLFGIRLVPRRSGALQVPTLTVGGERTQPLPLRVLPAQQTPRGDVFIDARVDDASPWVQQNVGLVVRLYYATSLVSGELGQDAPEGASLQRVGEDVVGRRNVGGREYQFVERRFLLVPERSGPLSLPPARFRGQAAPRFFDDFFGTDRGLSAEGPQLALQVRAQPAGAPQPWLPLHDLRLRYLQPPAAARVGEAVELVVEAEADGATGAQFPEIPVPRLPDAQVFAERAEFNERFIDGRPRLTVTRRFSIVPLHAGPLQVPGSTLAWWDAGAGRARLASLPPLALEVAAAAGAAQMPATAPPPGAGMATPEAVATTGESREAPSPVAAWRWLSLVLGVLWLATLAWALRLRRAGQAQPAVPRAGATAASATVPTTGALRRALDADSFDEAVRLLRQMARPPARDLDEVIARLSDPAQQDALQAMRRALWAGEGDPAQARLGLRTVFHDGPRWRDAAPQAGDAPLPPLYPSRNGG